MKEGTSAVLLQSGLGENGGQIPWNVLPICEKFKENYILERRFGEPLQDQSFRLVHWLSITLFL